ncbi:ATP-binding protein [Embleya sp. NPDC127516]|uniref:ATP-binding protein n=1 Tax=Embleya sp. NPDC127516 TaxID=3363990 RepID=UPI003817B84B
MTSSSVPYLHLPRATVVAKTARAYVIDVCAAMGIDRSIEAHTDWLDAVLVAASELATNAWKHTTGEIAIHWWVEGDTLTFAVTDTADAEELSWSCDEDAMPVDAEAGRGLAIVANLADRLAYGSIRKGGHDGKWVAASFTLPDVPLGTQGHCEAMGNRPTWHRDSRALNPGAPPFGRSSSEGCPDPPRAAAAAGPIHSRLFNRRERRLEGIS